MFITGCDYHPGFQQIAGVDFDTGELSDRRLAHPEQFQANGAYANSHSFIDLLHFQP